MASSSTSSIHKSFKYDVFLSFGGKDTRTNFVDHLYYALQQKSIHTYKDDERIKKGKNISDELIRSIEDSKFYIIVFSKNYASSSWCLDELVKIIECHKTTEHTAYPIFYDVEPSEVRNQRGAVAEAFAKLEKEEAAGKWREALKEAANLAGWELKTTANGHEAKFIRKIVKELSLELRSIKFNTDENLVGMESRIKEVVSYLGSGLDDVHMIGIKGIGGGGKTTLVRAVFDQISFQFEGKSFVENVREVSNASLSGLKSLQNQLLLDVLNDKGISVNSVHDGKHMIKRKMCDQKVLVVLDDVDHIDQLEALAGESNWFKSGSRIIITTRDEQVLVAHRVKLIHDVNLLSDKEAICLFSKYAFGRDIPVQGYEELSGQVICYAAGLPLTIKVLGSFLCGKSELEWGDALKRLKKIPLVETLKKMEISYTGLEKDYKEIFLDIACMMKGWQKDKVIRVLESCGFHAKNGLRVLEQKSLITIDSSKYGELVVMHDHLEEMGRNIVRRSYTDKPYKHSRLWIGDEIEHILARNLGTRATRCMQFNAWKLNPYSVIKGLRKMKDLRVLSLGLAHSWHTLELNILNPELPNSLRYLDLKFYPFRSLPQAFQANNLVTLEITHCHIEQLWERGEKKALNKLRFLHIGASKLRTIDLGLAPNLETLTIQYCPGLVDLHMPVGCIKLISVEIRLSKLRTLDLGMAVNLETLVLAECSNLVELHIPAQCLNLRSLTFSQLSLRTLNIGPTPNLESLGLTFCFFLEELQMASECEKLVYLDISHSHLRTLDLRLTPNLQTLYLNNLPESIYMLKHLISLNLYSCPLLEKLPEDFCRLECLEELTLYSTRIKDLPGSICMMQRMKHLELHNCYLLEHLPKDLGRLECLQKLIIIDCKLLQNIPVSIYQMKCLKDFHLRNCIRIEKLPEELGSLECLKELDIEGTSISHLPRSILLLKGLCIIGSRVLLQSCGFTSEIRIQEHETSCYVVVG
ncbi:hypothetical protein LXL04_007144 [Taraxacum kok-saghyz]